MKRAGKERRHGGAGDGDHAVLEGLAEDFEDVAGELGELVEEEEAVVGEGDFAGARDHASADEAGVGYGVVGGAEGAVGDEAFVAVEDAGDGVDLGGLEGFFEAQRGEDGREALGEHGFAGAGRADHEDVVAAGGGDFQGALGDVLAADVAEVGLIFDGFVEEEGAVDDEGLGEDVALRRRVEELADFEERGDGIDVDAGDDGGFAGVGGGDDEVLDAGGAGGDGDGEHALDGAEGAVEAELADQDEVGDVFDGESAVGSEDADGDGEIEAGAFFLEVGGGEVDGDAGGREIEAGVLDGGADAVARLADGGVGEADGGEGFLIELDAGEVDFYVDDVGVDAVDSGAAGFEEHAC